MRWGLLATVLIGCNSGQGVDVEIRAEKPLTNAELWLAYDYCHVDDQTKCDGIAWPGAQTRMPGTVFTLGADEKVFRADLIVDGAAEIHLDAIADANKPIAIAVVGYAGTEVVGAGLLENVEIPLHDQAHWRIDLKPASPRPADVATADPTPAGAPNVNAYVWDRQKSSTLADPTGYAGCLAFQKWTGAQWDTFYFVPNSDTDCDGDPPDCNPYWYDASVVDARCVTNPVVAPNVCAVGALACRSETERVGCAAQLPPAGPMMCVGSALCTACADSPDLVTCLKANVPTMTSQSPVPVARCQILATVDNACVNSTSSQSWDVKFLIPGGLCAPALTNTEIAALRPIGTPFAGGTSTLPVGTGQGVVTVHASPQSSGTNGCLVGLSYIGGGAPFGQLAIVVRVSYGATREILLPVVLDFQQPLGGACPTPTAAMQCAELGPWPGAGNGDSMFSCATGG